MLRKHLRIVDEHRCNQATVEFAGLNFQVETGSRYHESIDVADGCSTMWAESQSDLSTILPYDSMAAHCNLNWVLGLMAKIHFVPVVDRTEVKTLLLPVTTAMMFQ